MTNDERRFKLPCCGGEVSNLMDTSLDHAKTCEFYNRTDEEIKNIIDALMTFSIIEQRHNRKGE